MSGILRCVYPMTGRRPRHWSAQSYVGDCMPAEYSEHYSLSCNVCGGSEGDTGGIDVSMAG